MYNYFLTGFIFEMNNKTRKELLHLSGGINLFLQPDKTAFPIRMLSYQWPVRDTYEREYGDYV